VARPVTQGGTPISRVQHLDRFRLLVWLNFGWVGLAPSAAPAGAWLPAPHHGVLIANLVEVKTDQVQSGTSFEFYGEYGLKRGWAVVVAPSLSSAVQSPNKSWVLDEMQVGARRKIYVGKSVAISTQISGFSIPQAKNQNERAFGVETRVAVGKSFREKGWVNIEAASRTCGETGIGSRFDATLGLNMSKKQRVIVKAFGDGNGCTKAIVRAQLSYVQPITDKLALEFGWRQSLDQSATSADRGLVVGLWQKF
jgi:hypothetical protein